MKRIFFLISIVLVIALLNSAVMAAKTDAVALVFKTTGDVKLKRSGDVSKLKFGATLNHGDEITTGEDGFASIMFADDKSLIKLMKNTNITIEGKRDEKGDIAKRVRMRVGDLFVKVANQRGPMEVATPTSLASVKGTEFWIVVLTDGTTLVTTLEGLVELMSTQTGKVVQVREGNIGEVDDEGNLNVREAPPGEGRGDPDPEDEEELKTIEIQVEDRDGNKRVTRIKYRENP